MKTIIYKLNIVEKLLVSCAILLLVINIFLSKYSFLSYFDEFLALIMLALMVCKPKGLIKSKKPMIIILSLIIIVVIGIIFNIVYGIIDNVPAILIDSFGLVKNHIIFLGAIYSLPRCNINKAIKRIVSFIKIYVVIVFICGLINSFYDIGMTYTLFAPRFGLKSYQFLYTNPGFLVSTMIVSIAFFDHIHYKGIIKYLAFFNMLITLRALAFMMIVVYLVLVCFYKFQNKIHLYHLISLVAIATVVALIAVGNNYVFNKESNRFLLLYYGMVVFKRFFPFGSGFATYGSQMAYTHYSPFYIEFGFLNHWGLNLTYGGTANDNYWPMIMAQFGAFGLLFMMLILFYEFKIVNDTIVDNSKKIGLLSIYLSLVLSTLASAELTGVVGTIKYFCLALLITSSKVEHEFKYNKKINN